MTVIHIAIPVLRGKRRFHIEKGRRWSLIEHLMLDAVAKEPASAAELSERSNLPRRIVVEAFIRLMRVGWVELLPGEGGLSFTATDSGRAEASREQLRAATVVQQRWLSFVIDQVTGSVFRRSDIALKHKNELNKIDGVVVQLERSKNHLEEDLVELFETLEGDDEQILRVDPSPEKFVERFAIVTISSNVLEGLPGRAKPELRRALWKKVHEVRSQLKSSEAVTTEPRSEASASKTNLVYDAIFDHSDVIIGGKNHQNFLDDTLAKARELVVIHSTFLAESSIPTILPKFLSAASKAVTIHVLWGQDDDKTDVSTSRRVSQSLQRAVDSAGRTGQIVIHPFTTRSHAKILLADNGRGEWSATIGSCNWLSSNFESFETSIRVRDPKVVSELVRQLSSLSKGAPGIWNNLTADMAVLSRQIASRPIKGGATAPMRILRAADHGELVLEARDNAQKRIFVTSHRLGIAGRPIVIIPTLAASQNGQVSARLYYGRPTGLVSGKSAADLTMELSRKGVSIRPVHTPRLHAKILAWDDDALAVTSQNW